MSLSPPDSVLPALVRVPLSVSLWNGTSPAGKPIGTWACDYQVHTNNTHCHHLATHCQNASMPIPPGFGPLNRFRVESPLPKTQTQRPQACHPPRPLSFPHSPVFPLRGVATPSQSTLFPFRSLRCLRPSVASSSSSFDHLRPLLESPSFPSPFLAARPFSTLRFSFTPFPFHFVPDLTSSTQPFRLFALFSPLHFLLPAIPSPSLLALSTNLTP